MKHVFDQTIEFAKERCLSLDKEIKKLRVYKYPSPAAYKLLHFIESANESISKYLEDIKTDAVILEELEELKDDELEQLAKRYCVLIPHLCSLLSVLEGAHTPPALIHPLTRTLRKYLPRADWIFRTYPRLNYSYMAITELLKTIFKDIPIKGTVNHLSENFAVVSYPKVETSFVLLHCMIAHEIGHGLYKKEGLKNTLIPLVKIDKETKENLARIIYTAKSVEKSGQVIEEQIKQFTLEIMEYVKIREKLSRLERETIPDWIEELTADAIATLIFGPAYFFAFVNFVCSINYLDSYSKSHPSPRFRMRLIADLLKSGVPVNEHNVSFDEVFDTTVKKRFEEWHNIAEKDVQISNPIYKTAEKSIEPILPQISDEAKNLVRKTLKSEYTPTQYEKDKDILCDLLKTVIPANETIIDYETKKTQTIDIISILNSGWVVYLMYMPELAKNLKLDYTKGNDKLKAHEKLNELLLASLELSEIKTRWDESKKC